MSTSKVLILTASYGDGHLKTASSISEELKRIDPAIEVKTVNLFHEAHPIINNIIKNLYLRCYSNIPQFYGFLYYSTKDIRRNFYLNNLIGVFGRETLKRYLTELQPDVVINTFPVLAMPILYKKGKTRIPCYTVITDYGIHSQWIDPGVKKYFVGNEYVKQELIEQGVEEQKICITGIPVTLECSEIEKDIVLQKYGLANNGLPVVTILTGANGVLSNIGNACSMLNSMKPEAQFLILCGKNKILKEKLEKATEHFRERIKVFGFVDNLHEIMMGSDVVVSKAGGITTTEALNMGVPLVIFGSPAGQENENTKFLLKNKCSYHAKSIVDLVNILKDLLSRQDELGRIRCRMKEISKPRGCIEIAEQIIKDIKIAKDEQCIENINTDSILNFN